MNTVLTDLPYKDSTCDRQPGGVGVQSGDVHVRGAVCGGGEESLSLGPDSSGHPVSPVIAVPVNTATR